MSCFNAVYPGCNAANNTRNYRVLKPCPNEASVRFDPCRGWLFDDPCCPFTFIGTTVSEPA